MGSPNEPLGRLLLRGGGEVRVDPQNVQGFCHAGVLFSPYRDAGRHAACSHGRGRIGAPISPCRSPERTCCRAEGQGVEGRGCRASAGQSHTNCHPSSRGLQQTVNAINRSRRDRSRAPRSRSTTAPLTGSSSLATLHPRIDGFSGPIEGSKRGGADCARGGVASGSGCGFGSGVVSRKAGLPPKGRRMSTAA